MTSTTKNRHVKLEYTETEECSLIDIQWNEIKASIQVTGMDKVKASQIFDIAIQKLLPDFSIRILDVMREEFMKTEAEKKDEEPKI